MALGIPLPGQPGEALLKGVDTGSTLFSRIMQPIVQRENMQREWAQYQGNLKLQQAASARAAELQPLQKSLLMAQAQQAIANANKANMWSQLLSGEGQAVPQGEQQIPEPVQPPAQQNLIAGLEPNYSPIPSNFGQNPAVTENEQVQSEKIISPGNSRLYGLDRVAGLSGMPNIQTHYDENGNLIRVFPSGKITSTPVSMDKATQQRNTEFAKQDAKIASEMTELVPHGADLLRTYSRLQDALNNPEWRQMQDNIASQLGGDTARKATLSTYKQIGSKKQKELIGKVQNLSRDIITKSASVFKGPFRVAEQGLLEAMKPSENEPVDVALSKLNEMQKALQFQQFVNTRVPTLIRGGLPPEQAFQQAMTESGADKFMNTVEQKYGNQAPPSNQSFDWSQFPVAGGQ